MNIGSIPSDLLSTTRAASPAATASTASQSQTFRGRPIIGYGRDGLPVLGETAEETQRAKERLIAAATARGQDVSNPNFLVVNMPVWDGPLGPMVAYQQGVALQLPTPKLISGSLPASLLATVLEPIQGPGQAAEPTHGALDSIPGADDATADGSDRIYAAFFHRGDLYATVGTDGAVTIEGTAAYLTEALAGVKGAEARTAMLEKLIRPGEATRYSDPATAPTFDELWNPKSAGT